jgi:predicted amidophosphoribosyltransferase
MNCDKCKAQLADNQKFCPKCGTKAPGEPMPGPQADPADKGHAKRGHCRRSPS